jgi:predicted lipid-binding transport protein (Tim44 family)
MGHDEFQPYDALEDEEERLDLSPFKGSARWANHIAPDLRAMAGHADSGPGTYTVNRQVAAIHDGCEEDEPAEADLVEARQLFQALVEAWDMGAYDGAEDTYDPDSAQPLF